MSGKTGHPFAGQDPHLQIRNEVKCMIVQNDLLHLYGELISFLYIKCLVHLFGKSFQPIIVIEATVLG